MRSLFLATLSIAALALTSSSARALKPAEGDAAYEFVTACAEPGSPKGHDAKAQEQGSPKAKQAAASRAKEAAVQRYRDANAGAKPEIWGQEVRFVRSLGPSLQAVAGLLAATTNLPLKAKANAPSQETLRLLLARQFKNLRFTVCKGTSHNEGGTINIQETHLTQGRKLLRFTLFHEIGHAVYSAIFEDHKHFLAPIVLRLDEKQKPYLLELFADAVATRVMKRQGEKLGAVLAAAEGIFESEGSEQTETHPSKEARLAYIRFVYANSK